MSGRAPDVAAPFCSRCRDMRTHDGAIEELDQMRRCALLGKQLEKHLENTRAAEPPETLPDTVPFAEFGRQRAPGDVVHGKVEDRLQELAIVAPMLAATGLRRVEHSQREVPVLFRHPCQHARPPVAGHAVIR